jgi:hypothetical protein
MTTSTPSVSGNMENERRKATGRQRSCCGKVANGTDNSSTGYIPIENYGLIGNMRTCALVGLDGSLDFMCWYMPNHHLLQAF